MVLNGVIRFCYFVVNHSKSRIENENELTNTFPGNNIDEK
jgi:hypothetical protein